MFRAEAIPKPSNPTSSLLASVGMSSPPSNPRLGRYEAEVWNQGKDVAAVAIDELIAPNFESNVPDTLPELKGKADLKRLGGLLHTAFPDGRYSVEVVQEKGGSGRCLDA